MSDKMPAAVPQNPAGTIAGHCLCLLCGFLLALPAAAQSCDIAFDMGSSGVRAGADTSAATARADIDYLQDLWADRHLDTSLPETTRAFRELPLSAGFPADCRRIAGGFSAWRLALELSGRNEVAGILARLQRESGVAVFVIPQAVEGRYGYIAARGALGERLRTSHILDIGGGSLQVAGENSSWGQALGQKTWNKLLCSRLRPGGENCDLDTLTAPELANARHLAAETLAGLPAALKEGVSLTAISRPVTRGVFPAVRQLATDSSDARGVSRQGVSETLAQLAPLKLEERAARVGNPSRYLSYLVSDLVLLEGILQVAKLPWLDVAELDLTNVPGLLADRRAHAWSANYACYLERLERLGEDAWDTDPASCR